VRRLQNAFVLCDTEQFKVNDERTSGRADATGRVGVSHAVADALPSSFDYPTVVFTAGDAVSTDSHLDVVDDPVPDAEAVDDPVPDAEAVDCLVVGADWRRVVATEPSVPVVAFLSSETPVAPALSAGVTDAVRRDDPEAAALLDATVERVVTEERERAERARQREWLETVLSAARDSVSVVDREGNAVYTSPAVEEQLGYTPAELRGQNLFEYVHPEDRDRVRETFEWAIQQPDGTHATATYRRRHADGSWRRIEAVGVVRFDHPAVEGLILNRRDVTEREAYVDSLLDAQPDIFYVLDENGTFEKWNARMSERLGYDDETIRELHATEIVDPADRETIVRAMANVYEAGETEQRETALVTADGEKIPYQLNGAPLTDSDGDVIGLVGTGRDVSDRVRREERLSVLDRVLRHNLRNLSSVLLAHADALEADAPGDAGGDTPRATGAIDRATDATDRRTDATDRQTDATDRRTDATDRQTDATDRRKNTADRRRPVTDHTDAVRTVADRMARLSDLARQVDEALEEGADRRTVGLDSLLAEATDGFDPSAAGGFDTSVSDPTADDATQSPGFVEVAALPSAPVVATAPLSAAFTELLDNAVRHNPAASPRVVVDATVDAETVTVTVDDDGPGLPERERTVRRAPESQLDHSTGLGLWFVQWVVEASGGSLAFEESPLGGTRVAVTLQRASPADGD
jgi:PAS domain S-box-containing protein